MVKIRYQLTLGQENKKQKTETATVLWPHLPFTVGFHELAEWSVPLDLKLHH